MTSEECVTMTRASLEKLGANDNITTIIETMFDKILAVDILSSAGVGTDNMTCIVVQLKPKK